MLLGGEGVVVWFFVVLSVEDRHGRCDGFVVCPVWSGQVECPVLVHGEGPAGVVNQMMPASADGYEVVELCLASLGHEFDVMDFGL